MIKALIIQDEAISSNYIVSLLNKFFPSRFTILKKLDNILETILWFKNNESPDIIFMDIQLSDGLCSEILDCIQINVPIIFTAAHDKHSLKAFKTNVIDYLIKPITEKDFCKAIAKSFKLKAIDYDRENSNHNIIPLSFLSPKTYKNRFLVKLGNKYTPIKIDDIAYFYKDDITFIKCFSGNIYPINDSLSNIENSINENQFFRANRTFLVNIDAIDYLTQYKPGQLTIKVKPKFDKIIILSQERSSYLKSILN